MDRLQRALTTLLVLATIVAVPCAPGAAAEGSQKPANAIAAVSVGSARVDWLPTVDYERLVLTITGPGDLYLRQEAESGKAPSLSLFKPNGDRLPDGTYTYELRLVPKVEAGKAETLPERDLLRSGYLAIRDGAFVNLDQAAGEPRAEAQSPLRPITGKQIISQGVCIGSLCGTGDEGFPLRLKEDVLLLNFEDVADSFTNEHDWAIQANDVFTGPGVYFSVVDVTAATRPFTIEGNGPSNALYVRNNGNLGLGTATPSQKLHVFGSNGATKAFIEEASGTTNYRELLEIRNNGGPVVILKDTNVAQRWSYGTSGSSFFLDEQAHSGTEYLFSNTGNLVIAGTLTQGSDRDTKRDLLPVRGDDVLAKLAVLPLSTWNLKTDDPKVRHLGPMAQDFAAVFGLGEDDRHIAPLDVAGVSLAAIQALKTEKDAEIVQLRRENTQLAERLATLEALVSAMSAEKQKEP